MVNGIIISLKNSGINSSGRLYLFDFSPTLLKFSCSTFSFFNNAIIPVISSTAIN
jgi:hypothetical protein